MEALVGQAVEGHTASYNKKQNYDIILLYGIVVTCSFAAMFWATLQFLIYQMSAPHMWIVPLAYPLLMLASYTYGVTTSRIQNRQYDLDTALQLAEKLNLEVQKEVEDMRTKAITESADTPTRAAAKKTKVKKTLLADLSQNDMGKLSRSPSTWRHFTETEKSLSSLPYIYKPMARLHYLCLLTLPAIVQVMHGGLGPGGATALWCIMSPISAIFLSSSSSKQPLRWAIATVLLMAFVTVFPFFDVTEDRPDDTPCIPDNASWTLVGVRQVTFMVFVASLVLFVLYRTQCIAQSIANTNQDILYSFLPPPVVNELMETKLQGSTSPFMTRVTKFLLSGESQSVQDEWAIRPRSKAGVLARSHKDVTVIFVGVHDFSVICAEVESSVLMTLVNELFQIYDKVAEDTRVTKLRTTSDGYLAASGLMKEFGQPVDEVAHATRAVLFGLQVLSGIKEYSEHTGLNLSVRVGMHSGEAFSGIVGKIQPQFDIFGDTANVAARIKGLGKPNTVSLSGTTRTLVMQDLPTFCNFKHVEVNAKGKGMIDLYYLEEGAVSIPDLLSLNTHITNIITKMDTVSKLTLKLTAGRSSGSVSMASSPQNSFTIRSCSTLHQELPALGSSSGAAPSLSLSAVAPSSAERRKSKESSSRTSATAEGDPSSHRDPTHMSTASNASTRQAGMNILSEIVPAQEDRRKTSRSWWRAGSSPQAERS